MNDKNSNSSMDWLQTNLANIVSSNCFTDTDLMTKEISKLISVPSENRAIACKALIHLLEAEYTSSSSIFSLIEEGLLHTHSIEAESKDTLIELLVLLPSHQANASKSLDKRVSRIDAGKLALAVLEKEINTSSDSSQLVKTVYLIRLLGYRPALAQIEAIAKNSSDSKLVDEAKKTHFTLLNSMESIWLNTQADYTSRLEDRKNHLDEALYDPSLNEYEYIQALFNATKDSPIESDTDPRLPIMEKLLSKESNYEILRLACAYAVFEICAPDSKLIKFAIDTVSDIGINGTNSNLCIYAASLLEKIEKAYPAHLQQIEISRQKANIEFLKKFKL